MKKVILFLILVTTVILFVSLDAKSKSPTAKTGQITVEDSLETDRQKYITLIKESIKGKEKMRADSVFKNISMLKVPAGRLLAIMNFGYSRSLGVSCGHCHNTSDFASEEKTQKDITRQMSAMAKKINTELLKNIKGLRSEMVGVNCTTCHRGEVIPALDLADKK